MQILKQEIKACTVESPTFPCLNFPVIGVADVSDYRMNGKLV